MKLIGKGSFTRCYLNDDESTVTLHSYCPIKECMALGWFPDSELFPSIEYHGFPDKGDFQVYTMEYFPRVPSLKNSLDKEQYKIYQALRKARNVSLNGDALKLRSHFESLQWSSEDLKALMIDALEACMNWGTTIGFEISPRNVAIKSGKLILLDCFFECNTLKKSKDGKLKFN